MSKLLLYCTKNKWRLFFDKVKQVFTLGKVKSNNDLNGKIVAECDYEVEEIQNKLTSNNSHLELFTDSLIEKELFEKSCLNRYEMFSYLTKDFTKKDESRGYAIHIKNLHIFDKPRELSEYRNNNSSPIEKAPQNMMYARQTVPFKKEFLVKGILQEVRGYKVNEYILISIQPQWLCLILNRIKDVEIRRVVLKEMLK